jgi:hypothetical protein
MKTYLKIPVIALGLFITEFSFAADLASIETQVVNTKSFKLAIKQGEEEVKLKLLDQFGQVLYNESIQARAAYKKVFNLSTLPTGEYRLELEYPIKIQVMPITVDRGGIELHQQEVTEMFKPFFRERDSKISINMLNTRHNPLKIRVSDDEGQLVYQDTLDNDLIIGKQYDLSELDPGDYTVNLYSESRVFSHFIMIE